MTPALNAGRYIARTLESVRAQRYPDVEHIVVDGGSRDDTAAIVTASGSARLIVEPGLRQAAAVNRGVAEGRGDVIVVLNADDFLYPDGLALMIAGLNDAPRAAVVYADAVHVDEHDAVLGPYPTRAFDAGALLESCYICQPASAVRRSVFEEAGGLDAALDFALDYDFWIRLAGRRSFRKVDGVVAASRMHRANKTLARRNDVFLEVIAVLRKHYDYVPYSWSYAYANWLLYRTDGFFDRPRRSPMTVLASLAVGLWLNPRNRQRFYRDWFGHRALGRR